MQATETARPVRLAYAGPGDAVQDDATTMAVRPVGSVLLASMLVSAVLAIVSVAAAIRIVPSEVSLARVEMVLFLTRIAVICVLPIVLLVRTRRASWPLPTPAERRRLLRGWGVLAVLVGVLGAANCAWSMYENVRSNHTWSILPQFATVYLTQLLGAVVPMLTVLLAAGRSKRGWATRLTFVLALYLLLSTLQFVHELEALGIWFVSMGHAERPLASLLQVASPWDHPWVCTLLALILALLNLRSLNRGLMRAIAVMLLLWAVFLVHMESRLVSGWPIGLSLASYWVDATLIPLAPALVLAWLSFEPREVLGDAPRLERDAVLAESVGG